MNKAILVGNITRDPETRTTASGLSCTTFTVACQRRVANAQGVREADFINCVAWRQTADFVARYFSKGSRIGIEGTIQTRSYDAQDGTKRFVTEVVVDNAEFVGGKDQQAATAAPVANTDAQTGFAEVDDDALPF